MLFAGLLINPAMANRPSIDTAVDILTNFDEHPNALRLREFVKALIPLVENKVGSHGTEISTELSLFDNLVDFDLNSGDFGLNWLMDLQ